MTIEFKYDYNSLRTQKKVTENGVTTTTDYILHGKLVTHMTVGTDKLHFFYDAQNRPAKVDFNGTIYTYIHNMQGDIVGILDNQGQIVVEYKYDAWGRLLSTSGMLADTLGKRNPFRYRGYVFDEESGLYYLQSRYYNPYTGRFTNADRMLTGVGSALFGNNIYVYCFNAPIRMLDSAGNMPKFLKILGSRLKHTLNIMARIVVSPLKAISASASAGVGLGAKAKVHARGVPIEVGAVESIADSISYEKGKVDVTNTTSKMVGVNVAEAYDFAYETGKKHSYFDPDCTCNFMSTTFGDKSECPANKEYDSTDMSVGFSAGLYLLLGGEISLSIDLAAWNEELNAILYDSLEYSD